jgi:TPR repeat protein
MTARSALLVALVVAICPACGQSPDIAAPGSGDDAVRAARAVDVDAPNGVCRAGARMLPHIGCVDDELSFSVDAIDACRSVGEGECGARCQKGDAPSCTALALVHQFALETQPNTTYAARLLDQSCAAGDGAACNDLGVLHGKGLGFPVDVARAETLYGVACDRGDIGGCANLARARTWGAEPPAPAAHAIETVSRACTSGSDARACAALATLRERGSAMERDEKLAASLFAKACDAGDYPSCDRLGRAYLAGDGVAADEVTALRLFRRACDAAQAEACTDLAQMYCMGRGVPRDAARSTALLRQCCDAGDTVACRARSCNAAIPL